MKVIIFFALTILLVSCYSKEPVKTGLEGKPMPVIELLMADSVSRFSTASLLQNKPTVIFAFEPWCPYSRAQAREFVEEIGSLQDIRIVMLTGSPYSEFRKFYEKYELGKHPNITAGIDYNYVFTRYFNISAIPFLAIYGSDGKLKQVMIGKNEAASIRDIALG